MSQITADEQDVQRRIDAAIARRQEQTQPLTSAFLPLPMPPIERRRLRPLGRHLIQECMS